MRWSVMNSTLGNSSNQLHSYSERLARNPATTLNVPISHEQFNEQVVSFTNDIENAFLALKHNGKWQIDAELAAPDSSRLRAVVDGTIQLIAGDDAPELAKLTVKYKLCADSFSEFLAVEHSSIALKARIENSPIIRWEYDRDARSKPSSHVQVHAHRGALSHILSQLGHETPHIIESLHLPMGGDRFRPCLEDVMEFLISDCGFPGAQDWRRVVREGRAKWRRIQTRAAVRDSPSEAVSQLEAMGYTVTPPVEGEPPERVDKLNSW
jgi:hypothetical protein